jgi:hypothetical protein
MMGLRNGGMAAGDMRLPVGRFKCLLASMSLHARAAARSQRDKFQRDKFQRDKSAGGF